MKSVKITFSYNHHQEACQPTQFYSYSLSHKSSCSTYAISVTKKRMQYMYPTVIFISGQDATNCSTFIWCVVYLRVEQKSKLSNNGTQRVVWNVLWSALRLHLTSLHFDQDFAWKSCCAWSKVCCQYYDCYPIRKPSSKWHHLFAMWIQHHAFCFMLLSQDF